MEILVAGSGQYIIKQVERRRVEPLKILEKKRQRVLWSGEDADESAEHQLEAALRLQRLELRDRRLLADDEPQFRDEVGHESTVRTERLEDSVAPHWTCLATGNGVGHAIAQELLRAKLSGQAAVAGLLGSGEIAELIISLAAQLDDAIDAVQLLGIEGAAAAVYWSLWVDVPLLFVRREQAPEHWQSFGRRNSPLGRKNTRNAVTPANAVLNYLCGVLASELTIALTGVGLDAGLGIFHTDAARRASLNYDAMEAVRPAVDGWLAASRRGPVLEARLLRGLRRDDPDYPAPDQSSCHDGPNLAASGTGGRWLAGACAH